MVDPVVSVEVPSAFDEALMDATNTLICLSMFSTLKDNMSKDQINALFNELPQRFRETIAFALYSKTEELLRHGYPSSSSQEKRSTDSWKL